MVYVSKPLWHIPMLCVQWRTPDDWQRNCPKHAEFYFKNKFEKLVHLVGFIIRSEKGNLTVSKICPTSTVVKNHEIPGMTSTLRQKNATAPYTHWLFAWHNRSIPTQRRQIAVCNCSLQHHTKQYGTSNGSPPALKCLICTSPGSDPGNDYSGFSTRSRV